MSDDDRTTDTGISRSRRALLAGAGLAGASALLAACGEDAGSGTGGGATDAPASGGASGGTGTEGGAALARTTEIPVGGGKILPGQSVVITQPTAGEFKAFSAICTHQNCPVSRIEDGMIDCTCHGSRFSIVDGSPQGGPATKPLPAREVTVTGDSITLV